jgi:hypothetical protein
MQHNAAFSRARLYGPGQTQPLGFQKRPHLYGWLTDYPIWVNISMADIRQCSMQAARVAPFRAALGDVDVLYNVVLLTLAVGVLLVVFATSAPFQPKPSHP